MKFKTFTEIIEGSNTPLCVTSRLELLKGLVERKDYHPEDNTYVHIQIVTDRLFQTGDIDLVLSGICHDLFKHDTLELNPRTGLMYSPTHDKAVAGFISVDNDIREWIISLGGDVDTVMNLCKDHMRFHRFDEMQEKKQKEFITRPHWEKLKFLGAADNMLEDFDINNIEKSYKWDSYREARLKEEALETSKAFSEIKKIKKYPVYVHDHKTFLEIFGGLDL
jgi:hypothetical protein